MHLKSTKRNPWTIHPTDYLRPKALLDQCAPAQALQSCLTLCDPWTVPCQAPLSMAFFRQEYWSGLPCPPPGELPNLGIEPVSVMSPALAGGVLYPMSHLGSPRQPPPLPPK